MRLPNTLFDACSAEASPAPVRMEVMPEPSKPEIMAVVKRPRLSDPPEAIDWRELDRT